MHRHLHGLLSLLPILAVLLLLFVGKPRAKSLPCVRLLLALIPVAIWILMPVFAHGPTPGLQLHLALLAASVSPLLVSRFRFVVPLLLAFTGYWHFLSWDFNRTARLEGGGSAPPHPGLSGFNEMKHLRVLSLISFGPNGNERLVGTGWIEDLVADDEGVREYGAYLLKRPLVIKRWRHEWHTWITNIHRADHIPAGLWVNGSSRKPGVPEYEVRPRAPEDRERSYNHLLMR